MGNASELIEKLRQLDSETKLSICGSVLPEVTCLGSLTVGQLGSMLEKAPIWDWSALPDWDGMSNLDKGAALMFLAKVESEGTAYATENWPCRYFDHPELLALNETQAAEHALRFEDLADELPHEESERLYDAALKADEQRGARS
jgi:hypothetical protein